MASVFVTRTLPGAALDRLAAEHEVAVWEGELPPPRAELHDRAAGAEGLLCLLTERIDGELMDAAPGLRVIANLAVGTDNVDLAEAARRGIAVGNTPGVLTEATAELAIALIFAAARRLVEAAGEVRAGRWRTWEPAGWLGADIAGSRLGIIGPGAIGSAVGSRAEALGMEVSYVGRDLEGLDRLLAESDFVSLHCPLDERTRGLIGAAELRRMKPAAILVNTARGEIVDTEALAAALAAGEIGGAALDVTDPEPLGPDHPLLAAPSLTVVPHIGSATHSSREAMADLAVDNLLAGLAGEPLPHPVAP